MLIKVIVMHEKSIRSTKNLEVMRILASVATTFKVEPQKGMVLASMTNDRAVLLIIETIVSEHMRNRVAITDLIQRSDSFRLKLLESFELLLVVKPNPNERQLFIDS